MNKYQEIVLTRRERMVLPGRRSMSMFRIALLLVASFSNCAYAEERNSDESQEDSSNKIDLFIGATHVDVEGRSTEKLSVGIGYEFRSSSLLGLGGIVEYTNGIDAWTLAPAVYVHPSERWRLVIATGVEFKDGQSELLIRVGAGHEFDFGGWSLSPEFSLDFVGSEVNEVLGVNIGWIF